MTPTLSTDTRGAAEIVSYAVITASVMTIVIGMAIIAPPAIEQTQEEETADIAQQQFMQLDHNIHQLTSNEQTKLQESPIPPTSIQHGDQTTITLSNDNDEVEVETTPIVHQSEEGGTTVYDAGLLGSDYTDDTYYESIKQTPNWDPFTEQQNIISIRQIADSNNFQTTDSVTQIQFNVTMDPTVDVNEINAEENEENVNIEIESSYPQLWEQYLFNSNNINDVTLTDGTVEATIDSETVVVKQSQYHVEF